MHRSFVGAVTDLKRDLLRCAHYLRVIHTRRIHKVFGYESVAAYAEAAVGFNPTQTETMLALGRNLERFPGAKQALADGTLSWSKARLIVTKADPADEQAWLEAARCLATGQLRRRLVAAVQGQPQGAAADEQQMPATAEALAAAALPLAADPLPDAGPLPPAAGPPLAAGPPPAASAPPAAGPLPADSAPKLVISHALDPEQYARWEALGAALRQRRRGATSAELLLAGFEALVADDDTGESTIATCRGAGPQVLLVVGTCKHCLTADLITGRGRFPADRSLLLAAACDATVQAEDGARRATIPPRLRRRVLARDGFHCQGPGCGRTRHLQIHHRLPRSAGGTTTLENLVTLCSRCHRELHRREEELRQAGRDPCL